jgi:hypothetical protein
MHQWQVKATSLFCGSKHSLKAALCRPDDVLQHANFGGNVFSTFFQSNNEFVQVFDLRD